MISLFFLGTLFILVVGGTWNNESMKWLVALILVLGSLSIVSRYLGY